MNIKVTSIIVVAIVVVCIAAVASAMMTDDSESDGVTYYGNGGVTSDGKTKWTLDNSTIVDGSIFSYDRHSFLSWNTESDGSGTTYNVGAPSKDGLKLYAQWSDTTYHVTSYVGTLCDLSINGKAVDVYTSFTSPATITLNGGSDWTLDPENNKFTGTIGEDVQTIEITIGSEGTISNLKYSVVSDVPTITFEVDDDIGIYVVATEAI